MENEVAQASRPVLWRSALDTVSSVALVVAATAMVWTMWFRPTFGRPTGPPQPPVPTELVSLDGAAQLGNKAAKVALIEYGDFQCPGCGQFAKETFPGLLKKYVEPGKVLFAFRHFPLERMHLFALKAAEAVECAGQEGRFWEMHHAIFMAAPKIEEPDLRRLADSVGLVAPTFAACLGGEVETKVRKDIAEAMRLKITGVPTFLVGTVEADGRVRVSVTLSGVGSADGFYRVLDKVAKDSAATKLR